MNWWIRGFVFWCHEQVKTWKFGLIILKIVPKITYQIVHEIVQETFAQIVYEMFLKIVQGIVSKTVHETVPEIVHKIVHEIVSKTVPETILYTKLSTKLSTVLFLKLSTIFPKSCQQNLSIKILFIDIVKKMLNYCHSFHFGNFQFLYFGQCLIFLLSTQLQGKMGKTEL